MHGPEPLHATGGPLTLPDHVSERISLSLKGLYLSLLGIDSGKHGEVIKPFFGNVEVACFLCHAHVHTARWPSSFEQTARSP